MLLTPKFLSRAKHKDTFDCKYMISPENNVFLGLEKKKKKITAFMSYNRVTSLATCTGLPLLGAAEATPGALGYQQ